MEKNGAITCTVPVCCFAYIDTSRTQCVHTAVANRGQPGRGVYSQSADNMGSCSQIFGLCEREFTAGSTVGSLRRRMFHINLDILDRT